MRTTIIRVFTTAALAAALVAGAMTLTGQRVDPTNGAWPPGWQVWGTFATAEECSAVGAAMAAEEGWAAWACSGGRTLVYTYR
ncbi:hypothetical protein GCM10027290_28900 [Micromonospora sonneratiae]|uniref:Uncharacterized protein n=1 Tax=Micromonospora sonneratiae TaxID=1184706 RepID=A0ABW3Y765_9ACTN